MSSNDPRWRPRARCLDCKETYPLDEAILHRCPEAEARVRAASAADRWWVIGFLAALAVVCAVAAIVGRMIK